MRAGWAVLAILPACVGACAQTTGPTLVAVRPGLMCRSPAALARLTLPDGSSRLLGPHPTARDYTVKQSGSCLDFGPGERLALLQMRHNTSIVMPPGQPFSYLVPNIDFRQEGGPLAGDAAAPAVAEPPRPRTKVLPPPAPGESTSAFAAAIQQACPAQSRSAADLAGSRSTKLALLLPAMKSGEQRVAHDEVRANCRATSGACANETLLGVMMRAGYLPAMVKNACTQPPP